MHHCPTTVQSHFSQFNSINVCCSQSLEDTLTLCLCQASLQRVCLSHCIACLGLIAMNWSLNCVYCFREKLSLPGLLPETLISIRLRLSLFFSVSVCVWHQLFDTSPRSRGSFVHLKISKCYVTFPQSVKCLFIYL